MNETIYAAPFNTPEECDHQESEPGQDALCTHCCPCPECGRDRRLSLEAESNPYAVGSIWHTSWGYDQTNVEFYTVVRETAASVWVVPMHCEVRDGRLYPTDAVLWTMHGPSDVAAVPEMHRKGKHGAHIRMDYVRSAWPYTGGGCYDTYAAGQPGH